MSANSVSFEDQTVEDGELMHSPSDLQSNEPPSGVRPQPEIMDFSLSEEEEASGVRDDDIEEDDEDHMDSLVIKPPQAQVALGSQGVHPSSHRGSRESRRQRDGHVLTDRHGGSNRGSNRHDRHRIAVSDMGTARKVHRDHRERKKHKHYDREKERIYSKPIMYSVEHQQHSNPINYAIEMAPHHHQSQSQSMSSLSSSRIKEGDRSSSSSHHRNTNSTTSSNKHESIDRSYHINNSSGSSNKKGGSSGNNGNNSSGRRDGSNNSRGDNHGAAMAPPVGVIEGEGIDEKQQQADRALKDLRDRLLSKRVVGKGDGDRGGSNRSNKRSNDNTGNTATNAGDALDGEAGQLVKEIIDISTSVAQQQAATGGAEPRLTEEEQAEKEVRRKRLLVAEREMSRQKEQSRQERQERLERIERQRQYQQLQQQEEREQQIVHDDNMDDVVVVTLSSENSISDLDDVDVDSNHGENESINHDRRGERIHIDDDGEEESRHHNDSSNESGEHKGISDISEDDDDEQVPKSRSRNREKARDRDRKHGSRKHRVKARDERGRREKDKEQRRRDSDSDEREEHNKDTVPGDVSPGAATSGGGSNNSRDKERRGHRDSRLHRSHSPRLSRSPRSLHSHSPNQSRSPISRSRSRSRSPHRNTSCHILLRSSRSRSRSRSTHRKSKTPPTISSTYKDHATADKEGNSTSSRKETSDSIIHIDETLPPYYPAIQGCRPVEEFRCLNRIEEGTYGVVYRAQDKRTREIVALKKLKMEKEKEGFPITSLREINTLLKGQHPNIVTVREIVVGSHMDKIFIVMDYVEHDLKSLMETMRSRRQAFSAGEVKCLLRQLLMAVAHLHDNWILHRDLKTSNLLLSHRGVLKVGDFGLAREYGSPLRPYTPIVVTLWYRAPELLLCTKEYSTPVDVWSVGCIMGELVLMNALFPGKSEVEQLTKIFKELGTPNEIIWPDYPNLPAVKKLHFTNYPVNSLHTRFPQLTTLGCGLLKAFLTYDPKQRVTAEAALHHDYFTEAPLAIDPAMFPTWPAKSELGVNRTRTASPKPPSGGREYKQLGGDDSGFGFRIGISVADSRRLAAAAANAGSGSGSGGFNLKF